MRFIVGAFGATEVFLLNCFVRKNQVENKVSFVSYLNKRRDYKQSSSEPATEDDDFFKSADFADFRR
jgi:hypothetical protein